ncbi:unnamed protein product [Chondrus crispus]|uniref:Large ribosomal subunit protein uL24c n=1 Tax=Chondrus crispus TaxID=2769 RepID=R7QLJ6_CHOCR|nr:unnamed protein product [Chondrus crispus]CDF39372.1 unnamed protein product [Chondrus crispus]|eukprot:XP_005719283.1 unnamed protein product [Chondrus crispus]
MSLRSASTPVLRAATSVRTLANRAHLAVGKRVRRGGGVPGARYGGKPSTEMAHRSESVLESIRTPKPVFNPIKKWRVLRGDLVQVISGPERGKRGRVLEVVRAANRVVVEGVQLVNKYAPQPDSERKKKVRTEAPIYVSRVAVVCPVTDKPTRVSYRFLEDGTKVRVSKAGAVIPRPDILKRRRKERPDDSPKDTAPTVALERTFEDEDGLYDKYAGFKALIDSKA